MGKPITKFADGSYLEYAQGKFDQWCVYLTRPNQPKYAPQDWQYFRRLADWATKHNAQIYTMTLLKYITRQRLT